MMTPLKTIRPNERLRGSIIADGVMLAPDLSDKAKLVYARLCRFAGNRDYAWPSVKTLAEEIGGCSVRDVQNALRDLEDYGLIHPHFRRAEGIETIYYILDHPHLTKNAGVQTVAGEGCNPLPEGGARECTQKETNKESMKEKAPLPPVDRGASRQEDEHPIPDKSIAVFLASCGVKTSKLLNISTKRGAIEGADATDCEVFRRGVLELVAIGRADADQVLALAQRIAPTERPVSTSSFGRGVGGMARSTGGWSAPRQEIRRVAPPSAPRRNWGEDITAAQKRAAAKFLESDE